MAFPELIEIALAVKLLLPFDDVVSAVAVVFIDPIVFIFVFEFVLAKITVVMVVENVLVVVASKVSSNIGTSTVSAP